MLTTTRSRNVMVGRAVTACRAVPHSLGFRCSSQGHRRHAIDDARVAAAQEERLP
jgi:hypothetical protein